MPILPKSKLMWFCILSLTLLTSTFATTRSEVARSSETLLSMRNVRNKDRTARNLSTSIYPTEYTCINDDYESIVDVTYSYSIETTLYTYSEEMTMARYIEGIIANFESELLFKLSEELLSCNGERSSLISHDEEDTNISDLGIVEISSNPKDEPSQLSRCTSAENDCTVIHGSLTILLETDQHVPNIRYAALSIINDSMKSGYFTSPPTPRVDNLINISYRGPSIISPDGNDSGRDEVQNSFVDINTSSSTQHNGGMTTSGLLMATLVSTIVGFFAAFVLFKKINSKQSCMAACDGSGIDRDFMESQVKSLPILPLSPGRDEPFEDDTEEVGEEEDVQVLHYDIANGGLSVISETSEAIASNADVSFGSNLSLLPTLTQQKSIRPAMDGLVRTDSESICSERTTRTSNRALKHPNGLSTPHFGIGGGHII